MSEGRPQQLKAFIFLTVFFSASFLIFYSAFYSTQGFSLPETNRTGTLVIKGWPFSDYPEEFGEALFSSELANDPVLGRIACPALSRLDLRKGVSTPLLARYITTQTATNRKTLWRFELRSGIYWWNREPVNSKDVANFIKSALPTAVEKEGAGLWKLPVFSITEEPTAVVVKWESTPSFGPFILNGIPLARQTGPHGRYECAGLFGIQKRELGWELVSSPGYKSKVRKIQFFTEGLDTSKSIDKKKVPSYIKFLFAKDFSGHPSQRPSDTPAQCTKVLNLPMLTVINWNKKFGYASRPELRKIFTGLVPRGELLKAGAAYLGDLLSGPIPREHPGYNKSILVRPFQIEQLSKELDQLGFNRREPDKPRLDQSGKPFEIKLRVTPESKGLVEKVVTDSFAALGIGTTFESGTSYKDDVDGILMGIRLPWPGMNLLADFHSSASSKLPFWGPIFGNTERDRTLDQMLEAYATSLTYEKPDFRLLQDIHKQLFEGEPLTILLQHQVCLEVDESLRSKTRGLTVTDPDWFRNLIY